MALDQAPERPSSLREDGSRNFLFPAEVKGKYRSFRNVFHFFLLIIFLVLPWVQIGGHQAILLDIARRKFAILGVTFWAHDAPMIFFVLAALTLALAFVTAIWGRVWCGWACPQTVFVEAVFRKVEIWIQGSYLKRRRLVQGPWTFEKLWKQGLKWLAFIGVSLVISHSFLAYFVGVDRLGEMMARPPSENITTFGIMAFITLVVAFDFGWFREQFCFIMCPYGRIQALLMDEDSMAVVYDEKRGEPRRGLQQDKDKEGDCVNCDKCVKVCPTGIDIRQGMQMECVACTACMDACDGVMEKLKRPLGLIRYDTLHGLAGQPQKKWRGRTLIYLVLIGLSVFGIVHSLNTRQDLDVAVIRALEAPYTINQDAQKNSFVLNHFKLNLKNQSFDSQEIRLVLAGDVAQLGYELIVPTNPIKLDSGKSYMQHIFVKFPPSETAEKGQKNVELILELSQQDGSTQQMIEPLNLLGPVT